MGGSKIGGAKRPLIKESIGGENRIASNVLIELIISKQDQMTESLPEIDEINEEVESINMKIMQREVNDHENKMFDIKYEYGFREQNKIKKMRGGRSSKKRVKKDMINIGGGGAAEKL